MNLRLIPGAVYLPKDDESKPRGEDAHFICVDEHTIGVADGVGGWARKGVDSGEYARELMNNSVMAVYSEPKGAVNPLMVLNKAYSNTKAEGSSTACIVTLTGQWLYAVNVGDSGFVVVREGKVIYRSPVQQRSFNCPYQLGNSKKCDRPSKAKVFKVVVEAGDVIVAGSDGLFDNMFKHEIGETVLQGTKSCMEAQSLACRIAGLALYNSFNRYASTPFMKAARKAGRIHRGGKIDDITVVVAYVVSSDASTHSLKYESCKY
ncbi:hypothetical protein HHK36_027485 [Tetracentron sinense]|uniref:Protein phosphatase n=1 Tax=Tetracentron sinense TaxID=13715 RepID=A0A834YDB5_TETSI|nr:hypothetical protein HHK36_027485 [Tetracentron sinense]